MNFTYDSYEYLLDLLKDKGYDFCNYNNYKEFRKPIILRHDIDFSIDEALEFAKLENRKSIKSTYFVLLSTDFYNIFSKRANELLKEIMNLGHKIGLHFDEKRYDISNVMDLEKRIEKEASYLEGVLCSSINVVSMHRPSKWILENDIQFVKVTNAYSRTFMEDFKYLSDSRMHWKEDVLTIVRNLKYEKLHILTHPFWYSYKEETMKERLLNFINQSKLERYNSINDNFRDLDDVFRLEEI